MKFLQFLNMKKPSKEPPQKKAKTEEPSRILGHCKLCIDDLGVQTRLG